MVLIQNKNFKTLNYNSFFKIKINISQKYASFDGYFFIKKYKITKLLNGSYVVFD